MSSVATKTAALESPVERRFYSRFVPSAPIRIGPGELFNICENGLLISTPIALKLNSVLRVSLGPETRPSAIQVCARVVWTDEPTMRAGVQLLDLSDQGREQIREWGVVLGSSGQTVKTPPVAAKDFTAPFTPTPTARSYKEERFAPTMPLPARDARKGLTAAFLAALFGLLVGTLCAGTVIFFRNAHSPINSAGSRDKSGVPVARVPIDQSPASRLQNPESFSTRGPENEISEINPSSARPSVQIIPPYSSAPQGPDADPGDPAVRVTHINRDRTRGNQGEAAEAYSEQQRDTSATLHSLLPAAEKTDSVSNKGPFIGNLEAVAQQPIPGRLLSVDRAVPFSVIPKH